MTAQNTHAANSHAANTHAVHRLDAGDQIAPAEAESEAETGQDHRHRSVPETRFDAAAVADLEASEFAFPGPLRDRLVAAILDGTKTSTTSLEVEYLREGEPLPRVGSRQRLLDSAERSVAVIEITDVSTAPLSDIDLDHAIAEGEGFTTVAEWRRGHEAYWHGTEFRGYIGDPAFTVDDATRAVLERFRVIQDLRESTAVRPAL